MTTKAYLSQAMRFDAIIKSKIKEVERYKDLISCISVESREDRIQSSGNKDKIGEYCSRIVDLDTEIDTMEQVRDRIIRQIEGIDNLDYYKLLSGVYLYGKKVPEMCRELYVSKPTAYKKYNESLENFEKKYGKTYLDNNK